MSQFAPAFHFTMQFEDPRMECEIVPDGDGHAISGINSLAWSGKPINPWPNFRSTCADKAYSRSIAQSSG